VGSIRITAQWLLCIEIFSSTRNRSPCSSTGTVVKWELQVSDSISLETRRVSQPSLDLSAQVISNSLGPAGVDKVSITGVKFDTALLVQLKY